MAAGLGQDQNQPRWAQNPYPSALGVGRAEGHGGLSLLHFRLCPSGLSATFAQ